MPFVRLYTAIHASYRNVGSRAHGIRRDSRHRYHALALGHRQADAIILLQLHVVYRQVLRRNGLRDGSAHEQCRREPYLRPSVRHLLWCVEQDCSLPVQPSHLHRALFTSCLSHHLTYSGSPAPAEADDRREEGAASCTRPDIQDVSRKAQSETHGHPIERWSGGGRQAATSPTRLIQIEGIHPTKHRVCDFPRQSVSIASLSHVRSYVSFSFRFAGRNGCDREGLVIMRALPASPNPSQHPLYSLSYLWYKKQAPIYTQQIPSKRRR